MAEETNIVNPGMAPGMVAGYDEDSSASSPTGTTSGTQSGHSIQVYITSGCDDAGINVQRGIVAVFKGDVVSLWVRFTPISGTVQILPGSSYSAPDADPPNLTLYDTTKTQVVGYADIDPSYYDTLALPQAELDYTLDTNDAVFLEGGRYLAMWEVWFLTSADNQVRKRNVTMYVDVMPAIQF